MSVTRCRIVHAVFAAGALVATAGVTACSGSSDGADVAGQADKIAEKIVEDATGGTADMDTDDGSVTIETDDGTISYGSGDLPQGWPAEILLPDDFEVTAGTTMPRDDGEYMTVLGTTTSGPDELVDFYKAGMVGWETQNETTIDTDGRIRSAQLIKGDLSLLVSATEMEPGVSELTLVYTRGDVG